jgi:hypothetical protein
MPKNIYKKTVTTLKKFKDGEEKLIKLIKTNKKDKISTQNIQELVYQIVKKNPNARFMVRAKNLRNNTLTFKTYDGDLEMKTEEEYLVNKAEEFDDYADNPKEYRAHTTFKSVSFYVLT